MKEPVTIIKIGGQVLDQRQETIDFLKKLISLPHKKILIHGGGKLATDLAGRLGIETKMVDGRRITDTETLKIATMVYAGWTNKMLVADLQALGISALGLCGADLNLVEARKRPVQEIDFGWVGDVSAVDLRNWTLLLENGILPVMCAITHDGNGQLLNTNADTMASEIASALVGQYSVKLIYCFEKKGVLFNPEDEESVIHRLDKKDFDLLKTNGVISKGMIPKLENAFKASAKGIQDVYICAARDIYQYQSTGTQICLFPNPD
ncbi:MAG: acetylglutamate kinase [Saprospiraceae bacterium]|nr:acetylglutamate kinase [Saprospiraceae bacterium]